MDAEPRPQPHTDTAAGQRGDRRAVPPGHVMPGAPERPEDSDLARAMSQGQEGVPRIPLRDGSEIPQLGFGVFQVPPDETQGIVELALETGYRHIDTAAAYRNEAEVGSALRASGIPRDQVFVTTKLWNSEQGRERTLRAFDSSLERLGLDQVDLYLIHWPVPAQDLYVETWRILEALHAEGRARSIGVSNFRVEDLDRLERETETMPAVNQIELHPALQQEELRAWHGEHGVVTEAWSPLAQGAVLEEPAITEIAEGHGKTAAQVILRWHLQLGNVVFPKSATPERVRENFDLFGFDLSGEEMQRIAEVDRGRRIGPDPATFTAP
jgi:2,5-diketo-D-gluconate reductase A